MAGEWRETTLDQLGRIVTGKTPSSTCPEHFNGHIPFVTPKDLDGRRIIQSTERYLTKEGADAIRGSRIQADAVMVSCIGSDMGKAAMAGCDCVTNQQINSLLVDSEDDPLFIYYNLSTRKEEIRAAAGGSAQPILNKSAFGQLSIVLPPPSDQRAIAHILGTLDDKIELNRRMNETLEAMAQAIFKSWFVGFDPVRAKAEGRDTGLPKEIADLFPDSFENSALGKIPKGWRVKALGELLHLSYGKALKAEDRRDGNVPVYGSNGQIGWHDEKLATGPGIIVGRKGNPGIVIWTPTDFFSIDTTFYVVTKADGRSFHFLFYVLKTHDLASLGADSAVPGLNRNLVYMSKQVVPPKNLLEVFDSIVQPLFQRIHAADNESRTLAALRDALLPMLLSGEIRLRDAERFAEGVV